MSLKNSEAGVDSGNEKVISHTRAGDVQEVDFGGEHFYQITVVG